MKVYQIYFPELSTYVKFKVLEPEEVEAFIAKIPKIENTIDYTKFKKNVIDHFIFNLKNEISESLRMMSRKAAETCINAMYVGCVMLNPSLDLDGWINIAYAGDPTPTGVSEDEIEDDFVTQKFLETIKNFKKNYPKLDDTDFPFMDERKQTRSPKPKQISKQKFLGLNSYLRSNIIGQEEAIDSIVSALRRSQAGLNDAERPLGVFLFAGSSGVGKTHLANTLHKYLFGNEYPMVRIDCGEFQHKHENQKLIGSPPGYVGHEEGGQLVNLVKKNSSTVVLLDEVEKAHPDLWNTFLRVFDDGVLTDAKGDIVNFKNTIIIMTTNLGNDKTTEHLLAGGTGFTKDTNYKVKTKIIPSKSTIERNTNDAIRKHFKPEFLNRIDKTVIFNYLSDSDCVKIAQIEMSIIAEKLNKKGFSISYNDKVIQGLIEEGIDSIKGARGLAQIRREKIESQLAESIIELATPRGSIFELDYDNHIFKLNITKPVKKEVLTKEV